MYGTVLHPALIIDQYNSICSTGTFTTVNDIIVSTYIEPIISSIRKLRKKINTGTAHCNK